jgi:two-component system response regulator EvgA
LAANRTLAARALGQTVGKMCASVLIVDDHEGFRAGARRLLEAGGWEVVGEAADGASGVDAARSLAPDVVLLDLNLPDASGLELVAALAGSASVVLTSTHEEEELDELARVSGACGFLPKSDLSGEALAAVVAAG